MISTIYTVGNRLPSTDITQYQVVSILLQSKDTSIQPFLYPDLEKKMTVCMVSLAANHCKRLTSSQIENVGWIVQIYTAQIILSKVI